MLLGKLDASLLGNILAGKGMNWAGKGFLRAGFRSFRSGFLVLDLQSKTRISILPHPLTNFEMQKYYQNEPRFSGIYSRDNLPKNIKDGAYVINLDEYSDIGIYWVALYALNNTVTYFDNFGVEHIPKRN